MRLLALCLFVLGVTTIAAGATVTVLSQEDGFPHPEHEGLFPVCTGCHAGVESAVEAEVYPEAELCARCHDGAQEAEVPWAGPTRAPSNVVFDHMAHAASLEAAGDPTQSCASCHASGPERMSVDGSEQLETCWSCHAHETDDHFAGQTCETCHVSLTESRFDRDRIAGLPVPASHEDGRFLSEAHGDLAATDVGSCSTCHTQERCVSCHVDDGVPALAAMPKAGPTMDLPLAAAAYPVPASHVDEGWLNEHGVQAPVGTCSTCHTQDGCAECHVGELPEMAARLPTAEESRAPGVGLVRRGPESHESAFFMETHSTLAVTEESSCASCHTEPQCVECHDGPSDGGYHPPDFVARHGPVSYGRDDECATCHNAAAFCLECHRDSGAGSSGRLQAGYHDAEPLWLLRHGTPARQSLESCASCHQQTDCVQCHGVLGAFKVSPHREGFDARAAWARNPRSCAACHVGNPIGGGVP